jgi:pimeloyl-ACP methyl ester carboxylesterase
MTQATARPMTGAARDQWRLYVDGLAFGVIASRGAADRPALVLVHGIGVSHRYLSRLHDVLAEQRTVFSIDLPGFGGLPKPVHDVDVATMAAALATVIETLQTGPVVLVGHSMGSQWVVELTAERPDLVAHVVAMGPVADARHRSMLAQTIALARDTLGEPPDINAIVFSDYLRCGVPWYLTQLRHMLTYPIEDRVPALIRPLLVIRGSRDPIAGLEWCRMLRERAAAASLVVIPGQHHVAQHSAPRAVAAAILAHVL